MGSPWIRHTRSSKVIDFGTYRNRVCNFLLVRHSNLLGGYIFGNVRDKASNITWRYAIPCRPITDSKVNDLECLFHVKVRF